MNKLSAQNFPFQALWLALLGLLVFASALARAATPAPTATPPATSPATASPATASSATARAEATLKQQFPKIEMQNFQPVSAVPGLYSFSVNGQVAYTDSSVSYILVGELIAPNHGNPVNVTKATIQGNRSQLFANLPKDRALKVVFGKGEHTFAVFSDPNCPFCEDFEGKAHAVGDALNATEYVYLYPMESLHPGATAHAEYIACAADPSATWVSWMTYAGQHLDAGLKAGSQPDPNTMWQAWLQETKRSPIIPATCGDKGKKLIEGNIALGRSFGFNQTPTLLFSNGTMFPGDLPIDKLQQAFQYAEGKQ